MIATEAEIDFREKLTKLTLYELKILLREYEEMELYYKCALIKKEIEKAEDEN